VCILCVHMRVSVSLHRSVRVPMYVHTNALICTHRSMCTYEGISVCTHQHTHAHKHTHMLSPSLLSPSLCLSLPPSLPSSLLPLFLPPSLSLSLLSASIRVFHKTWKRALRRRFLKASSLNPKLYRKLI